jgi:hypothetical protein
VLTSCPCRDPSTGEYGGTAGKITKVAGSDRRGAIGTRRVADRERKASLGRFHDAATTGDAELISETMDELVEPDAVIQIPLPLTQPGPQRLKEVFARLHRAFPDLHITIELGVIPASRT